MMFKACRRCGLDCILNEHYDAYYYSECNIWVKNKCKDRNCSYCKDRPSNPIDYSIEESTPILEKINEITESVPDEEWDKLPKDGSINIDHYIYGTKKK